MNFYRNSWETFFYYFHSTFSFPLLIGIGATFRVSSDMEISTAADRRLPNTDVVLALLKWIERYMMHRKPPRFCGSMAIVATPTNLSLIPSYTTQPLESQVEVGH